MPTQIDSLQLNITASTSKAVRSITSLYNTLNTLKKSLSSLNSITNLNVSLNTLSNSFQNLNASVSSIDSARMKTVASSIKTLSGSINSLSNISNIGNIGANISNAISGLQQLGAVNIPNASSITGVANALSRLAKSNLQSISASMPSVVVALNRLSTLQLGNFGGLTQLGQSLSIFGRKTATQAITTIPLLAVAFKNLIQTLSTAPQVSRNVIDLANALGNFMANLNRVPQSSNRASKGLHLFGTTAGKTSKKVFSLASAIGKLYATYLLLFRLLHKIGDSISYASSLKEVQNVVDTTFGQMTDKVEDFASTSIEKFGMSELSAKQFASRFQAMGVAMSIPSSSVQKAQQQLNAINPELLARGYNDTASSIADVSINLTKLTADMSSFYNVEQEDVAKDLESIFTGMTRPLRAYGLDLTEATLREWAMKNGLDANIKSMTQAEKTLLRYQYVLANTSAAQGDFAKTSMTWANQIRILKQNFQRLGAVIGSGFIAWLRPMVVAVNNAMNSIIAAVQKVVNALGKIFGWEMIVDTTGESLVDDTEGIADAWDDATDSAKKYAKQLLGIDELNNLTTNDGGKGSGDDGGSGGLSGGSIIKPGGIEFKKFESDIDTLYELGKTLSEGFAKLLPDDWSAIYEKAANFGSGLADFLNGLIQPDTFKKLGKTIAGAIMTAVIALASFSNEADWTQYGTALGESINGFFEEFDAEKFMDGVNSFADGIWEAIIAALHTVKWSDVWSTIVTLINNTSPSTVALVLGTVMIKKIAKWTFGGGLITSLGTSLSTSIETAGGLGAFLFKDTAALSAAGVSAGTLIGAGIIGGLAAAWLGWHSGQGWYMLITGDETDYGSFGEQMGKIVDSIVEGDAGPALKLWWEDIWGGISAFFTDVWDGIVLFFSESWKTIKGQLDAVGGWFVDLNEGVKNGAQSALEFVVDLFGKAWEGIKSVWNGVVDFFKGIWNGISNAFSTVGDFFKGVFENAWNNVKTIWNAVTGFFQGIWNGISTAFSTVGTFFTNMFKGAWEGIKGIWDKVVGFFKGVWDGIKSIFSYVGDFFKGIFEGAANAVHGVLTGLLEIIKAPINLIIDGVNLLIGGLNHIKVPDWVPLVGGKGIDIPLLAKFEYGGFPDQGSLFVAGETYGQSEWVGNINGRTGVTSGYEITGIATAIYDTSAREMEMLRQQNDYLYGILNKQFGISRDSVGEAARSYAKEYNRRTGKQAYSF